MRHLTKMGFHTNSVRRKMHGFSTLWDWLKMQGYTDTMATEHLRLPKQKKSIANWLTKDELETFANTPDGNDNPYLAARNSIAWQTMAWLGLRRSEVLNLRSEDVKLADGLIIIREPKNGEDRALPLTDKLIALYRPWLADFDVSDWLLRPEPKQQWLYGSFWRAFKQHLRTCRLDGRDIKPHSIRHSFATLMIEGGVDVSWVSLLLGHKDIKNTMRYVHANHAHLKNAMSKHPLGQ
jgi:site-specific recombinase XerD